MPAILLYLGETLGLLAGEPAVRALTMKVVMDANDVLDDITLDGGRLMWTPETWRDYQPRLRKWMSMFEETGRRHGLAAQIRLSARRRPAGAGRSDDGDAVVDDGRTFRGDPGDARANGAYDRSPVAPDIGACRR